VAPSLRPTEMKPLILQGGSRPITYVHYNRFGDLLFSCCKDHTVSVWWSDNGERIGVYRGHTGAVFHCDVTYDSKLLLTGGGEYAARFWEVHSGKCLLKLDTAGPVKAVGFTSDAKQFFIMCNPVNKLTVFDLPQSLLSGEVYEGELVPKVTFSLQGTAARSAIWMPFNKVIACGGDDGKLRFYDTENPGTQPEVVPAHSGPVMRLAFNKTKSLFVTASKDTTAKLFLSTTKKELKTYKTPAPVNHAVISPLFNHVMCAGGQEARDVALRGMKEGNFELKFYQMIDEKLFGLVRGHFGTVNTCAIHPDGGSFCSGGEDGFIRLHHFDPPYFRIEGKVEGKLKRAAGRRRRKNAANKTK